MSPIDAGLSCSKAVALRAVASMDAANAVKALVVRAAKRQWPRRLRKPLDLTMKNWDLTNKNGDLTHKQPPGNHGLVGTCGW